LPSSDWRDFTQDWFCGCCEGHKHPNESGVSAAAHAGAELTNKQLPSARLEPQRQGDVFYNSCAVVLSWQTFGLGDPEAGVDIINLGTFQP
jgi:hypothetical protein